MSLPTVYRESKGLPVLEAWANAVGVVLPAHGEFPEMIARTEGGLLHDPLEPGSLAERLRSLLVEPQLATKLRKTGNGPLRRHYRPKRWPKELATSITGSSPVS